MSMSALVARARRVKARSGRISPVSTDRSPWDWYAESCACGLPAGECREHPRARPTQRAAGRRLASLGLYRRPRRRQDARGRRGFKSGSTMAR